MTNPAGESNGEALKLDFDRRLMLRFRHWCAVQVFRLPLSTSNDRRLTA
jgi:hypothetical protein